MFLRSRDVKPGTFCASRRNEFVLEQFLYLLCIKLSRYCTYAGRDAVNWNYIVVIQLDLVPRGSIAARISIPHVLELRQYLNELIPVSLVLVGMTILTHQYSVKLVSYSLVTCS